MSDLRMAAALKYLDFGFSVIPVWSSDTNHFEDRLEKVPLIPWAEYQKRQPTVEEVTEWWTKWPLANVGIVTGAVSNLAVVDIDDNELAAPALEELIPRDLLWAIPMVSTPKGGKHLYFACPNDKLGNNARTIPGCDLRCNGGYVVAPPSVRKDGKKYFWIEGQGIKSLEPPKLPSAYFAYVTSPNSSVLKEREGGVGGEKTKLKFEEGTRDNDLFTTANTLVRGGMPSEEIYKVLETLIKSWGEDPDPKWIEAKISSAMKRQSRNADPSSSVTSPSSFCPPSSSLSSPSSLSSITDVVREFISESTGVIMAEDLMKSMGITSRHDRKSVSNVFIRLIKEGVVVRHGDRNGCYRIIDKTLEPIDFESAAAQYEDVKLVFDLHEYVGIAKRNIIPIAGVMNSGKTAVLLNEVEMNMDKWRDNMHYFSSEMTPSELRSRLEKFHRQELAWWKGCKFWDRTTNFVDVIQPNAMNFIDFLEISDSFYQIAGLLGAIYNKLEDGICFVAIQKKQGSEYGRGGEFSAEKARLYLNIDYQGEGHLRRMKVVKAKNLLKRGAENNCNRWVTDFEIEWGSQLCQSAAGWHLPQKDMTL